MTFRIKRETQFTVTTHSLLFNSPVSLGFVSENGTNKQLGQNNIICLI